MYMYMFMYMRHWIWEALTVVVLSIWYLFFIKYQIKLFIACLIWVIYTYLNYGYTMYEYDYIILLLFSFISSIIISIPSIAPLAPSTVTVFLNLFWSVDVYMSSFVLVFSAFYIKIYIKIKIFRIYKYFLCSLNPFNNVFTAHLRNSPPLEIFDMAFMKYTTLLYGIHVWRHLFLSLLHSNLLI